MNSLQKKCLQHGWECTELSTEHGWQLLDRGDPVRVGEKSREFAEDQGFTFPQGHFYLKADIAHPDEKKRAEIMDDLKKWCELFAALDIKAGVLYPGGGGLGAMGVDPERIFECIIRSLEKLSGFVKGGPLPQYALRIVAPLTGCFVWLAPVAVYNHWKLQTEIRSGRRHESDTHPQTRRPGCSEIRGCTAPQTKDRGDTHTRICGEC